MGLAVAGDKVSSQVEADSSACFSRALIENNLGHLGTGLFGCKSYRRDFLNIVDAGAVSADSGVSGNFPRPRQVGCF